jgi:AcrR family transcriptional regulator
MTSRREPILGATKALLWEIGYDSMSPQRVLEKSGAGKGSLYHHFNGKADLAQAALDEMAQEMCDHFDKIFSRAPSPLGALRAYLTQERAGQKGCRLGRLAYESIITEENLRAPLARYFDHVLAGVTQATLAAIAAGEVRARIPAKDIATLIIASIQGGYALSRIHNDPAYIEKATRGALFMLNALTTC